MRRLILAVMAFLGLLLLCGSIAVGLIAEAERHQPVPIGDEL